MFNNCSNLEYINFSNYIDGRYSNMTDMFNGVPNNLTYCSKDETLMPKTLEQLKDKNCIINDCSDIWRIKQRKAIMEKATSLGFYPMLVAFAMAFYLIVNFYGFGDNKIAWILLVIALGMILSLLVITALFGPLSQVFYKLFFYIF